MKILYLTVEDVGLPKGPAVHVRGIVRGLREMGCKVTLVASGSPLGEDPDGFVPLKTRRCSNGRMGGVLSILSRLLDLLFLSSRHLASHDLAYARDYHVALVSLLPKILLRRRLIYEINGLPSEEWLMKSPRALGRVVAGVIKSCERLAAKYSDRIVAVTEGLRQHLVCRLGVDPGKVAVVPNGVDTAAFHPMDDPGSLESLRMRLGLPREAALVLFVGNLASWQGIDTLLDSIPLIAASVPHARFLIVGDGRLGEELRKKSGAMSISGLVLFTGTVPHEEIPRYINLADVCVAPFVRKRNSRTGVSPLKIHEYMACGKAVVASRVKGLDFVEETGAGLLVEPEDPPALARGIVELLQDPQRRASMGRIGAELVEQNFDWSKRAQEIFRTALEQNGARLKPRTFS
ncbi:MAG: glycosyltransferase family 4 protein [Deltaproteobacteria bacterium]|nr:glycosyltransferase family 4 protein [Deltaproteobacteria bacterium]